MIDYYCVFAKSVIGPHEGSYCRRTMKEIDHGVTRHCTVFNSTPYSSR